MTKDDREYLNERFDVFGKLINAQFLNVNERLERIETQTTKTDGRISSNENKIIDLEKKDLTHILDCPMAPKIEKINEELSEYRLFLKHPKLGIAVIAGAVLFFIATTFIGIENAKSSYSEENAQIVRELIKEINTSQIPDTLRIF